MRAVFFVTVWPEPLSSAAGVRTRELLAILRAEGWELACVSPSGASPHREALDALGIRTLSCDPNRSPATDEALGTLQPDLVIFDRFVMEEQFGWRAREAWPRAFHVVDTQDLHSLRRAREALAARGAPADRILSPTLDDLGDDLLRELASLHRCDSSLVVSPFERELLARYGVESTWLPFSAAAAPETPGFGERNGFAFLGNFRHAPNLDSVRFTVREVWPLVRERVPGAELHLYGAYPPAEISALDGRNGIHAHGPVHDHRAALRRHRALLAPLRFGAGIKGKVLEAWATGTPVVGTGLAFEGMGAGGLAAESPAALAEACAAVHGEAAVWEELRGRGFARLESDFSPERVRSGLLALVATGIAGLAELRERNITGRILRHQGNNATKYFSRWIEAKNRT